MTTDSAPGPDDDVVITSAGDLLDVWRRLMGPGGFGQRSLWLIFLDADGRPGPTIMPIDDIPAYPDEVLAGLSSALTDVVCGGGVATVAMLLSRPGPVTMTQADRCWGRALAPLTPWPVHLATRDHVQPFAPDDLVDS